MEKASPARLYATLVGSGLVIAGIVGFFYNASFDTGRSLRSDELLGLFAVNGWHNLLHIATGLLGLACAGYAARQYALGIGLIYAIVAIWGFAITGDRQDALLDIVPVNGGDNFLHLLIGLAGLAAGAATLQPAAAKLKGAVGSSRIGGKQRRPRSAKGKPPSSQKPGAGS